MFVFSQMKKPYAGAMSGNEGASIALAYLMSEASMITQSQTKKIGDNQMHIISGRPSVTISGNQCRSKGASSSCTILSSEVIRCHQRSSEVIRGHQRSSEQLVYHSGIIW